MTEVIDTQALETSASELRQAMIVALTAGDDVKARKLGTELNAKTKAITDGLATAQSGERTTFMGDMHDALTPFEVDGLELAVKCSYDDAGAVTRSIVYTPVDATITAIEAAIDGITRPSTATKWAYDHETDADGKRQATFDFGKGARKATGNGNGDRTVGWLDNNGKAIALVMRSRP